MEAFTELRKRAREKCDQAIARAKDEYRATLTRIAALEQDLNGNVPSSHKTISSAIESVIPSDRAFTTVDVMTGLEALDSGRTWRKRSVDNHISRMRSKGLIRRLKKARNNGPALYARLGVEVDPLLWFSGCVAVTA